MNVLTLQEPQEAPLRPPPPQQPGGSRRLSLLPAMPDYLDDFGPEMEPIYDEIEEEEEDEFLPPPPPPPPPEGVPAFHVEDDDDELEGIIGQLDKLQAELGLVNK